MTIEDKQLLTDELPYFSFAADALLRREAYAGQPKESIVALFVKKMENAGEAMTPQLAVKAVAGANLANAIDSKWTEQQAGIEVT